MCLAVPSKILEINNLLAVVEVYGARKEVSLVLLPEDVEEGDYVLVHAGFALKKINHEVAQESLKLLREYAEALTREESEESL